MDWQVIVLAVGPGLIVWGIGLVAGRLATEPIARQQAGRITTTGFALVFVGLALLLVLSAVLSSSSPAS
jgi:energy-converting hydrogenase Eha subunit E